MAKATAEPMLSGRGLSRIDAPNRSLIFFDGDDDAFNDRRRQRQPHGQRANAQLIYFGNASRVTAALAALAQSGALIALEPNAPRTGDQPMQAGIDARQPLIERG